MIGRQTPDDSFRSPMPAAIVAPGVSKGYLVKFQWRAACVPAAIKPAAAVTVIAVVTGLVLGRGAGGFKTFLRFKEAFTK